ncbi:TRAP transporter small permease [Peptoniphilus sp. AGMB00490]|uniref:TRAP transporter small permease n=2 Tax=Peptoniphilus TaxID=162289 RepID=A0ACD6AYW7_9FIRM|nr:MULTISPECIES: TRAP transporter small permease [Peptoniphilus]NMW84354.1 TRAP transporter small permease [Peptoniphilus faecalis]OLR64392.1 C4-dicarboxylate ABC transporter permease [Peptoniphilus porci]
MKYLEKIIKFIMILSSAVLAIVTFLQVIMRFFFKMPVAWGQDIIRLSFVYLVFLGAAYCLKTNDHLNIDIIFSAIPVKTSKVLQIIINIILLGFFVFLLIYGIEFSKTGVTQKAPYTAIPMIYYYASIPISALFLIVYDLEIIMHQIKKIKDGDTE